MQFVTNYLLITNNVTIPGSGALPLPQGEKQVEPGSVICSHLPCSTCVAMVLVINGEGGEGVAEGNGKVLNNSEVPQDCSSLFYSLDNFYCVWTWIEG